MVNAGRGNHISQSELFYALMVKVNYINLCLAHTVLSHDCWIQLNPIESIFFHFTHRQNTNAQKCTFTNVLFFSKSLSKVPARISWPVSLLFSSLWLQHE